MTTQPAKFGEAAAQIFLWEAFVSGDLKAQTHAGDAELAVRTFAGSWPSLVSAVAVEPSVNLAVASVLGAGHQVDVTEIGMPGVVVAA